MGGNVLQVIRYDRRQSKQFTIDPPGPAEYVVTIFTFPSVRPSVRKTKTRYNAT